MVCYVEKIVMLSLMVECSEGCKTPWVDIGLVHDA